MAIINGTAGNDTLQGTSASDDINGLAGDDTIAGLGGDDRLDGGNGNDLLEGGDGSDFLLGGLGVDRLFGGSGPDSFRIESDDGDTINGGGGNDDIYVNLKDFGSGVEIDLSKLGSDGTGYIGNTQIVLVEILASLTATNFDDRIVLAPFKYSFFGARAGAGNDYVEGTDANDSIFGEAGNDIIFGGGGNDVLSGGGGSDELYGGLGNDFFRSGTDDLFDGGEGEDIAYIHSGAAGTYIGGAGEDLFAIDLSKADTGVVIDLSSLWSGGIGQIGSATIQGFENFTITGRGWLVDWKNIIGSKFDDQITIGPGRAGSTSISGGAGDDRIVGGSGVDTIDAGEGDDTILAGAGDDMVKSSYGSDTVYLGDGDDLFQIGRFSNSPGLLHGGSGTDRLLLRFEQATVLDLSGLWNGGTSAVASMAVSSIEGLVEGLHLGSRADDKVIFGEGLAEGVWFSGWEGNDFIVGGSGDDRLLGEMGDDTLSGDRGNDALFGSYGMDAIFGGEGDDIVNGGDLDDLLYGNSGDDILLGHRDNDQLFGSEGHDRLYGAIGDDALEGGTGDDLLIGGGDNDILSGGADRDRLWGGTGADTFLFRAVDLADTMPRPLDIIFDFAHGEGDRIDLSPVDAVAGAGDDQFSFIGAGVFTKVAGQLHYRQVTHATGDFTIVEGDRDGNGFADFRIALLGTHQLQDTDFTL